jgi:ATP-binding cassette subfamily G (WHITE) protein 2 (SNQ2)
MFCLLRGPAEWMLTTIGAGDPSYPGPDWAELWKLSVEHKIMADKVAQAMECLPPTAGPQRSPVSDDSGYYSASPVTQALAVIKRAFVAQWRKPEYVYGKIIMHVVSIPTCTSSVAEIGC